MRLPPRLGFPVVGLGVAFVLAAKSDRSRLFDEYCNWFDSSGPLPYLLRQRIKFAYGEVLAEAAEDREKAPVVSDVLMQKSTLRHWFTKPEALLSEALLNQASTNV